MRRLGSDRASEAEREKERPHTHRTRLVPKSAIIWPSFVSPSIITTSCACDSQRRTQSGDTMVWPYSCKRKAPLGKILKQRACGKGERVTKQEGCFGPNMYDVPYHANNLFPGLKLLRDSWCECEEECASPASCCVRRQRRQERPQRALMVNRPRWRHPST